MGSGGRQKKIMSRIQETKGTPIDLWFKKDVSCRQDGRGALPAWFMPWLPYGSRRNIRAVNHVFWNRCGMIAGLKEDV